MHKRKVTEYKATRRAGSCEAFQPESVKFKERESIYQSSKISSCFFSNFLKEDLTFFLVLPLWLVTRPMSSKGNRLDWLDDVVSSTFPSSGDILGEANFFRVFWLLSSFARKPSSRIFELACPTCDLVFAIELSIRIRKSAKLSLFDDEPDEDADADDG